MGRRKGGQPINGWIAIDKPLGMTSTAVVTKVRRMTDAAKVGHGGTLDPLASGILPIALGEATKTVAYVMDGAKSYRWQVTWGEARSTDDGEGEVVATSENRPSLADIEAVLPRFLGEIEQVPPAYSAVKIGGQRAYALARAEQSVELRPRIVRIDSFTMIESTPESATFEVGCGKGAYIRSLARDLALALDTVGYVSSLRRTRCGPFDEINAISLDMLEEFGHSAASANLVLPVETVLDDIPALALTEDEARRLQNGQSLSVLRLAALNPHTSISAGVTVRAMAEERLVALARIDGAELRPIRVLNL
ncbi:tRNA pseudouridine(55) synthase TruB [Telmatospirillum siberiense]|uniref:tRNA pseudouridine synthase B n=1 Tax=Telmatospirillum siberiense TaxID=382514 RepID=A0A2N3PSI4_9PROT|nr:tRNA pseudouridine(55) synthase TruB [Telmatospirillum siberiense]PKU23336.1 tRNA pseudouridine(55) synthase TruB [Telmatospirillum siberiense]